MATDREGERESKHTHTHTYTHSMAIFMCTFEKFLSCNKSRLDIYDMMEYH